MLSIVLIVTVIVTVCLGGVYALRAWAVFPTFAASASQNPPVLIERYLRKDMLVSFPLGLFEGMASFMLVVTSAFSSSAGKVDSKFFMLQGIAFFLLFFLRILYFAAGRPALKLAATEPSSQNWNNVLLWFKVISIGQLLRIILVIISILAK
jgi:hypothetical protein